MVWREGEALAPEHAAEGLDVCISVPPGKIEYLMFGVWRWDLVRFGWKLMEFWRGGTGWQLLVLWLAGQTTNSYNWSGHLRPLLNDGI